MASVNYNLQARTGWTFDVLQARAIKAEMLRISGVREEALGQPIRPQALGCINCGAPWESVCSYCGTNP
jgi:hypothetical protein